MSYFLFTRDHLWDEPVYARRRPEIRKIMAAHRMQRRVFLGPHVTLCFENVWTLWYQIQEMLAVEKGGESQIQDELDAYNPLVPQSGQWVATLMIEVPDPVQRAKILACYTHIEEAFQVILGTGSVLQAQPIDSEGRTREDGKTSAVHFLRFDLSSIQENIRHTEDNDLSLRVEHPAYRHTVSIVNDQKKILFHDLILGCSAPCPFDPLFVLTSTIR